MKPIYADGPITTIPSSLTSGASSFVAATGTLYGLPTGFPTPGAGDFFDIRVEDGSGHLEWMRITSLVPATNTFGIYARALDGGTPQTFDAGASVYLVVTTSALNLHAIKGYIVDADFDPAAVLPGTRIALGTNAAVGVVKGDGTTTSVAGDGTISVVGGPGGSTDTSAIHYADFFSDGVVGNSLPVTYATPNLVISASTGTPGISYIAGIRKTLTANVTLAANTTTGTWYLDFNGTTATTNQSASPAAGSIRLASYTAGNPITNLTDLRQRSNGPAVRDDVSILEYGGDPTGVADSSAALLAAANTGRRVRLGAGTFAFTGTAIITRPVEIVGEGQGLTTIAAASGVLPIRLATGAAGASIRNLSLTGSGGTSIRGIEIGVRSTIENVTTSGFSGSGFYLYDADASNDSSNSVLDNITAKNCGGDGIRIEQVNGRTPSNITVMNPICTGNSQIGINVRTGLGHEIHSGYVAANVGGAIKMDGTTHAATVSADFIGVDVGPGASTLVTLDASSYGNWMSDGRDSATYSVAAPANWTRIIGGIVIASTVNSAATSLDLHGSRHGPAGADPAYAHLGNMPAGYIYTFDSQYGQAENPAAFASGHLMASYFTANQSLAATKLWLIVTTAYSGATVNHGWLILYTVDPATGSLTAVANTADTTAIFTTTGLNSYPLVSNYTLIFGTRYAIGLFGAFSAGMTAGACWGRNVTGAGPIATASWGPTGFRRWGDANIGGTVLPAGPITTMVDTNAEFWFGISI